MVSVPLLLLLLLASDAAEPQAAATQRVIAGRPEYQRSGYFQWHFGKGYRTLWTTPIELPVLDLKTRAGGLTPVRQVGSMQSIGLALKGADGKSYTFRTLDKDPTRILPPEWRESFPATLFQDQTTASHPGTAYLIPALADAAGVAHTTPAVVFMPKDDPALGKFAETFGGKPGTLDEYPTPAGDGYPGFMGATEILSTPQLWERWQEGRGRIDTTALLRARLFDLFLGDWDRHNGQWRWLDIPGHDGLVPLPEDRDQAFANFDGAVLALARSVAPRLLKWHDDYRNMDGLLVQGHEVDDWLLTGVERPAYEAAARELQQRLTDSVIESAVRRLPAEWYRLTGERLERDLKKRRDLLEQAAVSFCEHVSKWADVHGTAKADVVKLAREADGSARLEMALANDDGSIGAPYFSRTFRPQETDEVRVYLYGGDDRFFATGPRGPIRFRVSGDGGADRLDDSKSGGTRFYDVEAGEVVKGDGTGASSSAWTRRPVKKETAWLEARDFGTMTPVAPLVWWEPDPGIVLGFAVNHYRYGFRKQPYSSLHAFSGEWKTKRGAFAARYAGDYRWSKPGFATYLEAGFDGADNYNFYGFGNDTAFQEDEFNEADQQNVSLFPSLVAYETPRRRFRFALGPELKYSTNHAAEDTFIAQQQPYGFGDFGQAGARLVLAADTNGRMLVGLGAAGLAPGSQRRASRIGVELDARLYPKGWDVEETFGLVSGHVSGLWEPVRRRLAFGARVGGQQNWGRYPWHEAAFLGGSDNVRGYDRNRYAGDSLAYANGQVMLELFNLNLILPFRVGAMGLADVGRVWLEGEESDDWHTSYGGGIFLRVLTTDFVVHGLIVSGETTRFYVNIGYGI
jgi:hypothetical protein